MVEITARCHPALEAVLPRPVPAADALPGWLRAMPAEAPAAALGGRRVRTLKHCPPLIDALSLGLLIPLAADLDVLGGEIAWDWDPPALPDQVISRAPVGLHLPEQAAGAPFAEPGRTIVKFTNFWTLRTPPGWRLLFVHPLNRPDLPFQTLAGVVDCDRFGAGLVHIPALWRDPAWEGRLPAGTPVAQAIAIPRERSDLAVRAMSGAETAEARAVQEAIGAAPGVYRKSFRLRPDGRDFTEA